VLSNGRLRLGLGVGWNPVEYEALGVDWHTRGARQSEQVVLMRKLWTDPLVTFEGRFHKVTDAGLNPMPVQRPIPIWFGGSADGTIKRAARLGDGWMPIMQAGDEAKQKLDMLQKHLEAEGRDPAKFGIEAWLRMYEPDPQQWSAAVEGWRRLGAERVMIYPMYAIDGVDKQIETLRIIKDVVGG
jgi:probable F420-dependent oxidoreductase